ncbi:MAG: DUF2344 domain-containing protein [Synergistaceae bacterium]|nr:DUF2344 domain-containing protein [Synergistaceae bacterium]
MPRYRIFYEKRGPACFVPHIVLPTVFSRAASRASYCENGERGSEMREKQIIFQMTEGYSPHAKMSFASELPVGVVALNEAVDVWLENELSDSQFEAWSQSLPSGFKLNGYSEIAPGSPSLSKSCNISEYLLKARAPDKTEPVKKTLAGMAGSMIIDCKDEGEFTRITANNNAVVLGTIVRELISSNAVEGWHELCIVRVRVGGMDDGQ